jgi:type I restriction enzyme, S subunit
VSELPAGWAETILSEITTIGPKSLFDDDLKIGFVPMSHAPTNFRDSLRYEVRPWGDVKKAYTHFKNGDVIFAKVTPCFENGKAALVSGLPNGAGAGSSEFHVLRPADPEISAGYLLAVIKSAQFLIEGEENMTGAVGLRRVPRAFVASFPVCLPPAAEQKRIAQKLDALLAQVDTLKARIDAITALLKRFRHSVMASATSGALTANWRRHRGSDGWAEVSFEDVLSDKKNGMCRGPFGSAIRKEFFVERGYKVYEQKNAIRDDASLGDYFIDSAKFSELERFAVLPGDFIVSCAGTIGRVSQIPPSAQAGIINQALMRIRTRKDVVSDQFFLLLFKSPEFQRMVITGARGGAMQNMASVKEIKALEVQLPGLDEQIEIVSRVEQLFAFADQLEAKVATAKQRIDTLTQSILAKAFRGELVPQDPNDEPASVLLERIRADTCKTYSKRTKKNSA